MLVSFALSHCAIWGNHQVTQSIVAEFRILGGARYQKEMRHLAQNQKVTKFDSKNVRFALLRGHTVTCTLF